MQKITSLFSSEAVTPVSTIKIENSFDRPKEWTAMKYYNVHTGTFHDKSPVSELLNKGAYDEYVDRPVMYKYLSSGEIIFKM